MTAPARNWIAATVAVSVLVVLAAILGALSAPRSPDPLQKRPSTFFTDESGARALLLVMQQLLPAAEQWRRPLSFLPLPADQDSATTLIVADPRRPISRSEAEHLDRWLAAGGQLILATDDGWRLSKSAAVADNGEIEEARKELPEGSTKEATFLARHVQKILWSKPAEVRNERLTGASVPPGGLKVQLRQRFSATQGAKIVASTETGALAIEIAAGEGRIVAVADPTIVSNRALGAADNAVWLVTLVAGWGNGKVLFDEFHHWFGTQRSSAQLAWLFLKTPWGWCVLQIAAAGLLYIFGYRRRFGRISEPPAPARASPLELLEARGGLFQAAAAQRLAVELILQNLGQELAQAHGRPVDLSTLTQNSEALDKDGEGAQLLTSLQVLAARSQQGDRLADKEFIEVGRIAGVIFKGHTR